MTTQDEHRRAKARMYGSDGGTFDDPLPPGVTVCPGCDDDTLRRVEYGLLEVALIGFLEPDDQATVNARVEVRCYRCGWYGTQWRAKGEAA